MKFTGGVCVVTVAGKPVLTMQSVMEFPLELREWVFRNCELDMLTDTWVLPLPECAE